MAGQGDVFLLRGIGPPTHRIMTMKALEAACRAAGLTGTRSLLATGNILVASELPPDEVERRFARTLAAGGLRSAWQRRSADEILRLVVAVRAMPALAGPLALRPAKVQAHFLAGPVTDSALDQLRAIAPEALITRAGRDVVIDYAGPVSESNLTLRVIDLTFGPATTARNWNTVEKIAAHLA
jgi:uncharacterized protein (DUF1697 family)